MEAVKTLRLIFGDQLSHSISSLKTLDQQHDLVFMTEVIDEITHVKHHKLKLVFLLSAMRHFAKELKKNGSRISYAKLDDPNNKGNFSNELERAIKTFNPQKIVITKPSEYRIWRLVEQWRKRFAIPIEVLEDDRFLCDEETFCNWAKSQKQVRMDSFYRKMRQKHQVLMLHNKPVGGKWSFDSENRKKPNAKITIPKPQTFKPDQITKEIIKLVGSKCINHTGILTNFNFAVTRPEALEVLSTFLKERLVFFGTYQDAMIEGEAWMYHSHVSLYLNCGLLTPSEVINAVENEYYKGLAPLNSVEGFIRQILGWREFIRGIYWLKMPAYYELNHLKANRRLPDFYWTGETKMNCMASAINDTIKYSYAHHIQRLMVLGNFALLTGLSPKEVNEWFLIVYVDAYEWVELPNVSGMALFADGGYFASKPYAASGAYINRMSNYCKNCHYQVAAKNGEKACPFNYLYWNFLLQNKPKLEQNIRLSMPYRTLQKMTVEKIGAIQTDSEKFLRSL